MLASSVLFRCPKICRDFFRMIGVIPIDIGKPDLSGLSDINAHLERNEIVCFFPEGSIHKDPPTHTFKPGFAVTALNAGAPVIPVYLCIKKFPRRAVAVIGDPVDAGMYPKHPSPEELKEFSELVRLRVEALGKEAGC